MSDCPDILISLRPAYTKAILQGKKTVELRRRKVNVKIGTRVWLYSKVPTARVEGTARIERVLEGDVRAIWSAYAGEVGVSRAEFDEYFKGCKRGCAIVLAGARAIGPGVDLKMMRTLVGGLHPPQFFKRLNTKEVKALLLRSHVRSADLRSH